MLQEFRSPTSVLDTPACTLWRMSAVRLVLSDGCEATRYGVHLDRTRIDGAAAMELREEEVGGVTALAVIGRLDSASAPAVERRLEAAMAAPGTRLALDFGRLEYISSAGFRALLVAAKAAEGSGSRMVLFGLSAPVRQVFDLGGFLELFTVAQSRDEAIARAR
jgi:anti-anti-sigma factor